LKHEVQCRTYFADGEFATAGGPRGRGFSRESRAITLDKGSIKSLLRQNLLALKLVLWCFVIQPVVEVMPWLNVK